MLKLCYKLEIWYVSTHAYVILENIAFSTKTCLALLIWAFFFFLAKIVPLLKTIVWELCWRFFSSVIRSCKIKDYYWGKYKFYRPCVENPTSGWLQIDHKSEKRQWRHNLSTRSHREIFFSCQLQLLVQVPCQYCDWFSSCDNFR